jgi:hypothetical protein
MTTESVGRGKPTGIQLAVSSQRLLVAPVQVLMGICEKAEILIPSSAMSVIRNLVPRNVVFISSLRDMCVPKSIVSTGYGLPPPV